MTHLQSLNILISLRNPLKEDKIKVRNYHHLKGINLKDTESPHIFFTFISEAKG